MSKKIIKDEDWIREWQDYNLDWNAISDSIPDYFDINFVREFKDKISWLWLIYARNIEKREDIIEEFELNKKLEEINHRVDNL